MKIGIAIITHHSKHLLAKCVAPLLKSELCPRILVVNSSSRDGTVELATEMGLETLVVKREEFNHGVTREKARQLLKCDIVVMMTPDAYMESSKHLKALVDPILKGKASISYARQLPHLGASFFESFPREFNYPERGHIRSIKDLSHYGVYTYFVSNSCCAYLNSALDEIGGFQEVLLGEDTVVAAKLLRKGHSISYAADALVRHSHHYSLIQEFRRNFDTGIARKAYADLIKSPKGDYSRGINYVKQLLKKTCLQHPFLLPYAILQTLFKYAGYSLGKILSERSDKIKSYFSSQDFYWNSIYRQNRN